MLAEDGTTCTCEKEIDKNAEFSELVAALPEDAPRYVVLNFKYENEDGAKVSKIVFIKYIPEGCPANLKFVFANAAGPVKAKCEPCNK